MLRVSGLALPLSYTQKSLEDAVLRKLSVKRGELLSVKICRISIDARHGETKFIASALAQLRDEEAILRRFEGQDFVRREVPFTAPVYARKTFSKPPVVVGFGPAGIFAAQVLAQAGAEPIVLERGEEMAARWETVRRYRETGILNPESNVQFGEGGAGAFSDGKLNTGTRDRRNRQVLETLAACGAPNEILISAKPHIGTDKLRECIPNLRKKIVADGAKVLFGARLTAIVQKDGRVRAARFLRGGKEEEIETGHIILAAGHSARDVFEMLLRTGIALERKAFSLGVRVEHRQRDINRLLYGAQSANPALPAASYKASARLPNGRGVYTFCMCPGGTVQAAASESETVVTNGMSDFARDGENANSAVLVGVNPDDFGEGDALRGLWLQREIERAAYRAGGGKAPVILLGDFLKGRESKSFGDVRPTYPLGTVFAPPQCCLPGFVTEALRAGLPLLERDVRGFCRPDAVLTAPETRSSSPVRVLRDPKTLESAGLKGLYPCGEGAGYAGGIVSAAADGIRCAERILECATGRA